MLSVRERLAARHGRLHTMRTARRLSKAHGAAVELPGPASDEEFFKSMRKGKQHAAKKKRKESKRKRRSRSGH